MVFFVAIGPTENTDEDITTPLLMGATAYPYNLDAEADPFEVIEEPSTGRVRVQLHVGDIKKEDTQAIVRFKYPELKDEDDNIIYPALYDADGIMEAAGDQVYREYIHEKAKGGLYVRRGVVSTSAGNLPQDKIFHVEVRYDKQTNVLPKFKLVLNTALRSADKQEINSIAFPALLSGPSNFIDTYFDTIYEFEECENPTSLHLIRTIVQDIRDAKLKEYITKNNRKLEATIWRNDEQNRQECPENLNDKDEADIVVLELTEPYLEGKFDKPNKEEKALVAYGKNVTIYLQEGDIRQQQTDAIVRFIYSEFKLDNITQPAILDADGIMVAAGDEVQQEYQQEKSKGGLYVKRGIVTTSSGNLSQDKILHIEVQRGGSAAIFRTALHTALRSADRQDLKSIAFPTLTRVHESFITAYFEVIYEFEQCENPTCLHCIRTVVANDKEAIIQQYTRLNNVQIEASYFEKAGAKEKSTVKKEDNSFEEENDMVEDMSENHGNGQDEDVPESTGNVLLDPSKGIAYLKDTSEASARSELLNGHQTTERPLQRRVPDREEYAHLPVVVWTPPEPRKEQRIENEDRESEGPGDTTVEIDPRPEEPYGREEASSSLTQEAREDPCSSCPSWQCACCWCIAIIVINGIIGAIIASTSTG